MSREIKPNPGPQARFLASPADIAIYGGCGGGGKTFALLMDPLYNMGVPQFEALIFRRVGTQITVPGGLWSSSVKLYPFAGGAAYPGRMEWRWKNGFRVGFRHLEDEAATNDLQGAQIPSIGFDELTHFSRNQFLDMLSRNRSTTGIPGRMRATCNPDAGSWVKDFIRWWLDDAGQYYDPAKVGKLRWMVRDGDDIIWYTTKAEAEAAHGEHRALSVTFIPAKLSDNPALVQADPTYLAKLRSLGNVLRRRLEDGDWLVKASAGNVFKSEWFSYAPVAPLANATRTVRYWDRACLTGGTMVRTADGEKAIEKIKAGELVWTRKGLRRVIWSGKTKVVQRVCVVRFNNGSLLSGTDDHRVWTENRGWVPLAELSSGDYSLECQRPKDRQESQTPKRSSSTVSPTPEESRSGTTRRSDGIRKGEDGGQIHCTEQYGGITTAQYQKDTTCITGTVIGTTTPSKTWTVLAGASTTKSTTHSPSTTQPKKQTKTGEKAFGDFGSQRQSGHSDVSTVRKSSSQGSFEHQGSAHLTAEESSGGWPVYDLEVEGVHEFFANGILVHNSTKPTSKSPDPDWTSGLKMARMTDGRFWVLHVVRMRGTPMEVKQAIRNTTIADGPEVEQWLEHDPGQAGKVEASDYLSSMPELGLKFAPVPKVSKIARAEAVSAQVQAGNVVLVNGAWNNAFVSECEMFPDGVHDDQVDTFSGAFNLLAGSAWGDIGSEPVQEESYGGRSGEDRVLAW